jgi:NAD+ diphosphatase
MIDRPPGFTGSPLVRMDHERDSPDAVAAALADPAARQLRLDGLDPVLGPDGRLVWDPIGAAQGSALALLGLIDGAPRFVALVPGVDANRRSPALFGMLADMPAGDGATYAVARSLVDWHARNGFCPRCGNPTEPIRAGWARRCEAEARDHFPRTDPVVIMLAEHGGRVLIGRQPGFPPGRYSALAGFVEVGESIEEAVARELFEEAGVRATAVRYIASQPWPFPSSLMIACIADVAADAVTLDTQELEDAIWVTRDEVAAAMRGAAGARFLPPPAYAVAYTLFQRWLAQD